MFSAAPATPTAAYNWPGGYWVASAISDNTLDVCFADNTSPTFTNRAVILAGMNVWGQATDIGFNDTTDVGGLCLSSDIRVAWVSIATGAPARTEALAANFGGTLDLEFNSDLTSSAFYWGSSTPVTAGLLDVYDIGAHEAGHALGLGHVDEPSGPNAANFTFDNLCSGTYKWDVSCTYPTGPKNAAGKIYSGSLDPGVGNYSNSPRPNLTAGGYHINFHYANESLTRNPGGVRMQIYQGTTLVYTSPYTSGLGITEGSADLTWTSTTDLRFRIQFSKAAIHDIYAFPTTNTTAGRNLMEPWTPHCWDPSKRVTTLSVDDANGVQAIYPSHAITGVWPTDLVCS
jgi:hypothetical protein